MCLCRELSTVCAALWPEWESGCFCMGMARRCVYPCKNSKIFVYNNGLLIICFGFYAGNLSLLFTLLRCLFAVLLVCLFAVLCLCFPALFICTPFTSQCLLLMLPFRFLFTPPALSPPCSLCSRFLFPCYLLSLISVSLSYPLSCFPFPLATRFFTAVLMDVNGACSALCFGNNTTVDLPPGLWSSFIYAGRVMKRAPFGGMPLWCVVGCVFDGCLCYRPLYMSS